MATKTPLRCLSILVLLSLASAPAIQRATAQPLEDVYLPATSGGVATVDRALAKLSTHRRLLVIAAHPDDEDTSLLALVARGLGGEAAYLSLSRGEGGQNLIGTELGVGLGLVRSGELLSARRVDGARQFFTRAFDFGYTRSLDETLERWPREVLMEDARRVVRRFRPQVVVSVFPPTERAGHGQHQAAGVVATALFEEPGGDDPWRPQALYRAGWFDRESEALELPLGVIDPLDGRSILQLALASRSNHRSQDMGTLQEIGPRSNRLIPVAGSATTAGGDPFAGVDTRLAAIAQVLSPGPLRTEVEDLLIHSQALAEQTREELSPSRLPAAAGSLGEVLGLLEAARRLVEEAREFGAGTIGAGETAALRAVAELLEEKVWVARQGLAAAGGVVLDAFTDGGTLVPGETFQLTARLWNSSSRAVEVQAVEPALPAAWSASLLPAEEAAGGSVWGDSGGPTAEGFPLRLEAGEIGSWAWRVEVPAEAGASRPYFLESPLDGDLYDWRGVAEVVRGEPFEPAPLAVRFEAVVAGREISLERDAVHRYRDQARGEIRLPLRVVPALEVAVAPDLRVWPADRREPVPLEVQLTNHQARPVEGELLLGAPEGWPAVPPRPFRIPPGERLAVDLRLAPPSLLEPGDHRFRVQAAVGDERFGIAVPLVSYEHIEPRPWPREARALVRVGELALPSLQRVGYVRGASDRVPEALARIGVPIEELTAEDLAVGDLGRFPVIVVGSRAYETNPALGEANGRLLDYVRAGGRLVVQYQQYQFVGGSYAPFPLEIHRPHGRVTDEGAAVTVLQPEHPIFRTPNLITGEDWEGWVQERGLYFPGTWDEAYSPLLAMADPDQPEQRGALLVARLGQGSYVYTGLAFFRQLPAGVIGAYRLFLNLLDAGGNGGDETP